MLNHSAGFAREDHLQIAFHSSEKPVKKNASRFPQKH